MCELFFLIYYNHSVLKIQSGISAFVPVIAAHIHIQKRQFVNLILFRQQERFQRLVVKGEGRRQGTYRSKALRTFKTDVKCFQTAVGAAADSPVITVGIHVVLCLDIRHQFIVDSEPYVR